MEYRLDPKSQNKLSVLGFGCMRFPRGLTAQIDMEKTEKLIVSAIDCGVNYFDTAYIYGDSEPALGKILRKNNVRDKIFLATKLPLNHCKCYDDFEKIFQTQLERLKTRHIDYYLAHNLSDMSLWRSLCEMGIERWIAKKKAEKQIAQIGFSFHGSQDGFLSLLDAYDWDFCQIQYNYLDENYQAGRAGLQKAREKGLPVIIMEPLRGGKLANGLPAKAERPFKEADPGASAASWALRWLWDQPEVTVILSGMSSMEQLDDNIKTAVLAAPGMLSEADRAVFPKVVAAFSEAYKIPCTGCNYCMPCPQGVNIPGCFAAYNSSYAAGFVTGMQQYLTSTGLTNPTKHNGGGRSCVQCGACQTKCPQHIPIIQSLAAVTKRMEPFWFGVLLRLIRKFTG
jgi:predicted aldo/keto reductase-like oxidoreductase